MYLSVLFWMDFPLLKNELHMLVIDYSSINKLEKALFNALYNKTNSTTFCVQYEVIIPWFCVSIMLNLHTVSKY